MCISKSLDDLKLILLLHPWSVVHQLLFHRLDILGHVPQVDCQDWLCLEHILGGLDCDVLDKFLSVSLRSFCPASRVDHFVNFRVGKGSAVIFEGFYDFIERLAVSVDDHFSDSIEEGVLVAVDVVPGEARSIQPVASHSLSDVAEIQLGANDLAPNLIREDDGTVFERLDDDAVLDVVEDGLRLEHVLVTLLAIVAHAIFLLL